MSKTTKAKTAAKKASAAPRAAKSGPPAKTIYRLCVADEGRQMIGECGSADEAAKKAKAFQKKQAVPVEIARGKVVGSKFVADFTEVLQPAANTDANDPGPATTATAEGPAEPIAARTIATEAATPHETPITEPANANATPPATKDPRAKPATPGKLSALDAAAQVLKQANTPMSTPEMIEAMAKQSLWSSPNGKTPAATLYSAILREINVKAQDARFKKTDRGRFEFTGS